MPTEYRKMRLDDEDQVFAIRMNTWRAPSIEHVRQVARLDPHYLDHTFVAIAGDGTVVSTARYWLRQIRDAEGTPQKVGCVASVTTVESARRQGHGHKLMKLVIESMREEGCEWSLLLSSDMGVPLYTGVGYVHHPAPHFQGLLTGRRPPVGGSYKVERFDSPFDFGAGEWQAVREIYFAYNATRPLSLVRDDDYWRGYFARRVISRAASRRMALFLACTEGGERIAYLLADYSTPEQAQQDSEVGQDLDQLINIGELGMLQGHEGSLPALLGAVLDEVAPGKVGCAFRVPGDGYVYDTMRALFAPEIATLDCEMMALPLVQGVSAAIARTFSAPGALFWTIDDF